MKKLVPAIVLVLCIACSGKRMPNDVLAKDEMQKVVWDMIQADQYYREFVEKDSLTRDVKKERYALYEEVFKLHKISRATFDKSYDYYSTHPQLMKEVFDSMSVQGNRNLTNFYKTPAAAAVDTSSSRLGDTTRHRLFKSRRDSIRPQ